MTFCDLEPLFYIKLGLKKEREKTFDWYNIKSTKKYKLLESMVLQSFSRKSKYTSNVYRISSYGTLERKGKENPTKIYFLPDEFGNYGLGPDFVIKSSYQ